MVKIQLAEVPFVSFLFMALFQGMNWMSGSGMPSITVPVGSAAADHPVASASSKYSQPMHSDMH
jgi:hypothetical protein